MLPLRHAKLWKIASLMIMLLVLALAMMPAVWFWDDKTAGLKWFASIDQWLHGITFMVLSIWFAGLYRPNSYWKIALGLLAFGFVIEACQRMVSYRTADLFDVGADAAGIVLGLMIGVAGIGGWCLRVEERLVKN